MNTLDIIVVAVIALSGLFAFVRGFVREALSIVAWIGAGLVTYIGFDHVQPLVARLVGTVWVANLLTGTVLFLVSIVLFSIVVGIVSAQVRAAGLGPLDRALGLLFGVARGAVLLCLFYLVMSHFLPADSWPAWVTEASSRRLLATGAAGLQQLIPSQVIDRGTSAATTARARVETAGQAAQALQNAQNALGSLAAPPKPKPPQPATGYAAEQNREMTRAIEQANQNDQ